MGRLSRIAVDTRGLRESRDFRLLTAGSVVTGLGTQATLVALPYQVFVITDSAFLTGLLGGAELVPLIVASLFGGALADRFDRRSQSARRSNASRSCARSAPASPSCAG